MSAGVMWLPICARCDKPKAPLGCMLTDDADAKDYCMRDCPGYEGWPFPMRLPKVAVTKHVTDQAWVPEVRDDDVYLVAADDRTVVVKLCRPDHPSSLLMAGYIAGLQAIKLREQASKSPANPDLRTCPGCGRAYAMLYICERCGRCDALDLPRDADRSGPCCSGGNACVEIDWRGVDRQEGTSP